MREGVGCVASCFSYAECRMPAIRFMHVRCLVVSHDFTMFTEHAVIQCARRPLDMWCTLEFSLYIRTYCGSDMYVYIMELFMMFCDGRCKCIV